MNYLYFDIECCDGNHICSFGYIVVNEKFEILEKEDILINPECVFRLGRTGFDPRIRLAYTESEFIGNPNFDKKYEAIKRLLTKPDQIILGHSVSSDLEFLATAYKRYGKRQIEIDVYDTQKFFAKLNPNYSSRSLENILVDLDIDATHLTDHKSCDDAEKSMLVAKKICDTQNIGIEELIKQNKDCVVNYKTLQVMHNKTRINKVIKDLKRHCKDSKEWRCFYVSQQIEIRDLDKRINLVKAAYQNGYGFTTDISRCDYVVVADGTDITEQEKFDNLPQNEKPEIISVKEMSDMLKTDINEFGEVDEIFHNEDCKTSLQEIFEKAIKSSKNDAESALKLKNKAVKFR